MNLSINGQSQIPPGFRFHPTEDELLNYYLKKKVGNEKIDLDVIREVDLNKLEPWDFQETCKIGSTTQNDWYMFSRNDKKYPSGTRTNRATTAGFWKATGRDKIICKSGTRVGLRKTLVFYMGRAPHGQKSDWIMHEYRLDDYQHRYGINLKDLNESVSEFMKSNDDGWVVCRVFRKNNNLKTSRHSKMISSSSCPSDSQAKILSSNDIENPNSISHQIGTARSNDNLDERNQNKSNIQDSAFDDEQTVNDMFFKFQNRMGMEDWVTVDQFVASQLNCDLTDYQHPYDPSFILDGIEIPSYAFSPTDIHSNVDDDFCGFVKSSALPPSSSSDILCRLLA